MTVDDSILWGVVIASFINEFAYQVDTRQLFHQITVWARGALHCDDQMPILMAINVDSLQVSYCFIFV